MEIEDAEPPHHHWWRLLCLRKNTRNACEGDHSGNGCEACYFSVHFGFLSVVIDPVVNRLT
nr:hypothetical protein [uncultured bacterium]